MRMLRSVVAVFLFCVLLSVPGHALVPVIDSTSLGQLVESVSTLARQVQQLRGVLNGVERLGEMVGRNELTRSFKAEIVGALEGAGAPMSEISQLARGGRGVADQILGGLAGGTVGAGRVSELLEKAGVSSQAVALVRARLTEGLGSDSGAAQLAIQGVIDAVRAEGVSEASIAGVLRELGGVAGSRQSPSVSYGEARRYARDMFFVDGDVASSTDVDEAFMRRSAAVQVERNAHLRAGALDAWALAAVTHNMVAEQPRRHDALEKQLREAESLREDVAVLIAATMESAHARIAQNELAAQALKLQAMNIMSSAPVVLDEGARRLIAGQ